MSNRKKNCPGPDCSERITMRNSYCKNHFAGLPAQIRSDLSDARRFGNGKLLIDAGSRAREYYENKKNGKPMTKGKSNIVDVVLEPRGISESGKAQAFFQGDFKEDPHTGEQREVWIWLALSQIEVEELPDGTCEVSVPEWLAHEKGLI